MEQICMDVLNQWAKYTDYDEDQTSFNAIGYSWTIHDTTKKLKHIVEDYDHSGLLAVMTAKHLFYDMLADASVKVLDLFQKPEILDETRSMYEAFNSPVLAEAEARYIEMIKSLVQKVIGTDLLGEFDYESFSKRVVDCTDNVILTIDKCKVDVYRRGGVLQDTTHFSTSIHVFPSLAECVLTLDNAPDGMYLCFIDINHSADSYFGYFIKNNGNLFAVHERIEEAYKGSHQHSRNGRWTDGKLDDIFPYDFIFSYSDYDYKGYSSTYNIDENKLSLFEMDENAYIPLLVAMLFLTMKFKDITLEAYPQVYMDSLLTVNMPLLGKNETALAVIEKNEIVQMTNRVNLSFDYDKIMSGEALDEFVKDNVPEGERSRVVAKNKGQIFVDLYGEGFQIQPNILSTQKLLAIEGSDYLPEFVGTEYRFRQQAFYEIRQQLADYIRANMFKEYQSFGGIQGVKDWYKQVVREHADEIKKLAVEYYVALIKGEKSNVTGGWTPTDCPERYFICLEENAKYVSSWTYGPLALVNKSKKENTWADEVADVYDDDTGALCTMFFVFRPLDYKGLETLFGKLPKIVTGWSKNGNGRYGNSILDITDAVEDIGTPFEYYESRRDEYEKDHTKTDFAFCVGFSKRGLSNLCKKYGVNLAQLKKENADVKPKASQVTTTIKW